MTVRRAGAMTARARAMTVRRAAWLAGALAAGVLATAIPGGCGDTTKTVSVSSPVSAATGTSTAPGTTSAATPSTSATSTASTMATTTTRTASGPAFTRQSGAVGAGVAAATGVVGAHGYAPTDTAQYHPGQTLRVLVGTRTGSGDGYVQQAFFFVDGRYIGTDSSQASANIRVVGQSDTEVTLAYPLYRPQDPQGSPSGGEARVTFQLDNGRLTPSGAIPPARSSTGLSRR